MKTTCKLNRQELENLLTNAEMDGCIGYWVEEFISLKYSPYDETDYRLLSLTIKFGDDAPDDLPGKTAKIDHKTMQTGIDRLFEMDGYEHIKSSIIENDTDAETTDVIIQFGLFGTLIYA